ncbi:autotransporter assembly complex protein TamA [Roseivivax sediminis]|uniref:Autotransporter secretion outer membrane protein TamA n=1 Tax=Roseivivax sediminis TaxID=936889 RepID=A0A1I2ARD3_9RHOB|nr:autotransporter assembly complex family protein [Roseivivax sediminis]SFE46531.1 autotransporter secretion outer membrane protein TamA [Roseivivax sediminis]
MTATRRNLGAAGLTFLIGTGGAVALDDVSYTVRAPSEEQREEMRDLLRGVSLISQAENDGRTDPQDLVATALADYRQLLEALYARGYYSGVINITIDGREASAIPLLDLPDQIGVIRVDVETGPQFRFSRADIAPLPSSKTELPDGFAEGEIAESEVISDTVDAAIEAWREDGNAKARINRERVIADHNAARLSAEIGIAPGPNVIFGDMAVATASAVRESAIRRIAGFPRGEEFHPDEIDGVLERLRDTGAFSSVTLTEAEALGPGDTLDMTLEVSDQPPRRIGFGAEISTLEGGALNAFWLHRNLFGGAERFRVEGSVSNIGSSESGMDYRLSGRLDIPAIYGPRTDGYIRGLAAFEDEPTYESARLEFGFGATRELTDDLEVDLGLGLRYSDVKDDLGEREFFLLTFPAGLTLDKRSNELNPRQGYYVNATATPYVGLNDTQSGARLYADARYYLGFGDGDPNVLAGRLQVGSIVGSELTETTPDYLFYSGGGGTVRGQPYQSLNVDLGDGDEIGGRGFLGASLEYRRDITENLGAVAFYDAGFIDADSFVDGDSDYHAGAGLGLRYQTGIGPIRFDVAGPVGGDTGGGAQFYIGIGQAF